MGLCELKLYEICALAEGLQFATILDRKMVGFCEERIVVDGVP